MPAVLKSYEMNGKSQSAAIESIQYCKLREIKITVHF